MANVKLNRPSHLDLPEYKTSSKVVNPDWSNYTWTIVAEFFDPSHAYTFEQQLICDNWENPLLLNEQYRLGKIKQFRTSGPNGKKGIPNGRKGISRGPYGKQRNPSKNRGPNGRKGIPTGPQSAEHIKNAAAARIGQLKGKQQKEVGCPHCGKVGGISVMNRWHFDNCSKKPI